ncbi:MAG TPA: hypothetical protein VHU42_08835 [Rhodopila sp.]|jgi:hypothetical protein|nr:hypothetical protein [Rhodopila sp.]
MRTIILATLAIMIGVCAADAGPKGNTAAAVHQDSAADWANG